MEEKFGEAVKGEIKKKQNVYLISTGMWLSTLTTTPTEV